MDPVILTSARKHGIHDCDRLHAYHHPIRLFAMDDLVMLAGVASAEGVEFIVHAMPARKRFLG